MADSLRDQLLKSGIVKQVREEKRAHAPAGNNKPPHKGKPPHRPHSQAPKKPQGNGEIDLAKAYAVRAQTEAKERKEAEQAAQEQARLKRERKQKVEQLLKDQAQNKADADQARHFEYGGKIRRVYLDAAQLAAVNTGELGIVQQNGRYLVVTRAVAEQVRDIEPAVLALLVDPNASGIGEDGVPDDLMW